MNRTIFFDLDGTLTDPFVGITHSIQYALEKLDLEVPEANELAWCIGPPLLGTFETLIGNDHASTAVAFYREHFSSVGLYENTPYPGIHDALSALQTTDTKLCVASSKPHIYVRQILEHFELIHYFSDVFGSELDGTRTDKSELLRFALLETQVPASHATMIGDRSHDIVGALENEIAPIGVLYGYGSADELRLAGANRFANTPNELITLLL